MQATSVPRASRSESAGALPPQRLLWIDDQIASSDAAVSLLRLHGFDVECAQTGSEGLRRAENDSHAGIILDLRLPDMSGLSVLQHLAARAVEAPVLVVTGFAEYESAVAAIKLGAVDYRSKPLFDDELVDAVRTLVCAGAHNPSPNCDSGEHRRVHADPGLHETARRLASPSIGPLEFLVLARAFRRLAGEGAHQATVEPTRRHCTPEETAFATRLLEHLALALSDGQLPTLERVARETAVPAEHLNQILRALTHSGFRECRRALRVRPSLPDVAWSHEQIAQIAYHHRYQWPGQLDRDFKATLWLTPNEFRRISQNRSFAVSNRS